MIDRRSFLCLSGVGMGAMLVAPGMALATVASQRRFVFVIQRGAADGLNMLMPYADPAYATLRGPIAGDMTAAIKLDGTFALHPSLAQTGALYRDGQALFVHAVASPYRERSHFDGQNVLETGGTRPYQVKDGWLNRLASLLPKATDEAIAFAPTVPLALRGSADVTSYAPSALPPPTDDLLARVSQLYEPDQQLHALWTKAMETRGLAGDIGPRQDPASLGRLAATFLVRPNGPRIAMIETGGWDTHIAQMNRLNAQFKGVDVLIASLRDSLGPVWNDTVVLVATEFGRTAAVNGTGGTDHGTASAAMLIGGAVKGGRIVADWPGLANASLFQGRDLMPTTDLDALIATAAAETFALDPERVTRSLFPEKPVRPLAAGLVRA